MARHNPRGASFTNTAIMDARQLPHFHILLIDDSPDELRLLAETLRDAAFRLSVAFDGVQGYDRAVASSPDLILLDVQMAKMDGFATSRLLKANPATAGIPVIFLSARADVDARLTGLREGGVDYITKPFSPDEVLERVRIHLKLASGARLRMAGTAPQVDDAGAAGGDEVLVRAARRYLATRLAEPPSLDALARALGSNERRLSAAFHRYVGLTVFAYVREERMRRARHLLAHTASSIAAIAEEVGFSSAANFSTAFREHTGESPSAYRGKKP